MKSAEHLRPHWFPKGKSGNPGGRVKLPEHLKAIRLMSSEEVARIVCKYAQMTKDQLQESIRDPNTSILELSIASVFSSAIKEGDIGRLNQILDRVIGKVKDIEIDSDDEDLSKLPLPELIKLTQEGLRYYSKEGTENATENRKIQKDDPKEHQD